MNHKFKRTIVTSALPYANGSIHVGHLAGVYIPADVYVRFMRMQGEDIIFVGGSDEHGIPITIKAKKEKTTPQAIIDKFHAINKKCMEDMGISFDIFSRTSSKIHHKTSQDFFLDLYHKKLFKKKEVAQFFDPEEKEFLADRYIVGTCPKCQFEEAYGDQCEKCGISLSPEELVNPKSALSGSKPVKKKTSHWYLPLDKLQPKIEAWLKTKKNKWKNNVYGQCISWMNDGLKPRAITRDLDWGIPVPLANSDKKVLYVWFDAPIGYISATKELTSDWKKYWQDPKTRLIHFIGKDNIVFHCVIFPSILMQMNSYILPENVPANEFMNLEGNKISTSKNRAVWGPEFVKQYPNFIDGLRYYLVANAPEQKDSNFSWKDFKTKNNNELVAEVGNFINRTFVLFNKYFKDEKPHVANVELFEPYTQNISKLVDEISNSYSEFKFKNAVKAILNLTKLGNKIMANFEPWKQIETHPKQTQNVISFCVYLTHSLALCLYPIVPTKSTLILTHLSSKPDWKLLQKGVEILDQITVKEMAVVFPKITDEMVTREIEKLSQKQKQKSKSNSEVTFDDFSKLNVVVATIKDAKKVEKSDKLLHIILQLDTEERTVVSGIAQNFEPSKIVGKQICYVENLKHRKIFGILSQGMILLAEDDNGKLEFIVPENPIKNSGKVS